jgi:hypothetical protein
MRLKEVAKALATRDHVRDVSGLSALSNSGYCGLTGKEKRAIKMTCGSAWLRNGQRKPGLLDFVHCNMPIHIFGIPECSKAIPIQQTSPPARHAIQPCLCAYLLLWLFRHITRPWLVQNKCFNSSAAYLRSGIRAFRTWAASGTIIACCLHASTRPPLSFTSARRSLAYCSVITVVVVFFWLAHSCCLTGQS